MARLIRITLAKRGVSWVAALLEKEAPRTCEAVWSSLPQAGDAQHAKYARNEVYTMVPRFGPDIGLENPTVTPIPGDAVYFAWGSGWSTNVTTKRRAMPTELSVAFVEATINQRGIGVVAPFDFALDRELWRWVPDNVSLYLTRMPYFSTPVTVEMANSLSSRAPVRRATRDVLSPEPDIVRTVNTPEADAMFISCTNLPTYDVIEPLEQALGKPVLTANQVTMWSALRAMGLTTMGAGQSLVDMGRPSAA